MDEKFRSVFGSVKYAIEYQLFKYNFEPKFENLSVNYHGPYQWANISITFSKPYMALPALFLQRLRHGCDPAYLYHIQASKNRKAVDMIQNVSARRKTQFLTNTTSDVERHIACCFVFIY